MLKRETHRVALVEAATSGSTEILPGHRQRAAPGAPEGARRWLRRLLHRAAAIELYAEAFDNAGALDKLEGFASFHGADFYGLPRNTGTVTLRRETLDLPESFAVRRGAAQAAARRRDRWPGGWR